MGNPKGLGETRASLLNGTHKISHSLGPRTKTNLIGVWARPSCWGGSLGESLERQVGGWGVAVAHMDTSSSHVGSFFTAWTLVLGGAIVKSPI